MNQSVIGYQGISCTFYLSILRIRPSATIQSTFGIFLLLRFSPHNTHPFINSRSDEARRVGRLRHVTGRPYFCSVRSKAGFFCRTEQKLKTICHYSRMIRTTSTDPGGVFEGCCWSVPQRTIPLGAQGGWNSCVGWSVHSPPEVESTTAVGANQVFSTPT